MIRHTVLNIFEKVWPNIILSMVILISMRLYSLCKFKKEVIIYQELLHLLFVIYTLCLFYVVTFEDVSFNNSNLIIFKEMFRYDFGSRLFFKNVIGNVCLFIPYGFFTSYYLKLNKIAPTLVLSFLVSVTIEIIQSLIGRVLDIDDIILNVIGGTLGFYIYILLGKINAHLSPLLKKPLIYNIIVVCLLVLLIAYLIGLGV